MSKLTDTLFPSTTLFRVAQSSRAIYRFSACRQCDHHGLPGRGATRIAAAPGLPVLRNGTCLVMQDATLEQAFDQLYLAADRVVAPYLLFHGSRRTATVQADD